MAREKSEFLGAFGIAFRVFMALVNAVLRAGGNDEIVRLVEKPGVADKLATQLMAEAGIEAERPKPDLIGLEVFELEVDGDLNWFQRKFYPCYCNENARAGDFIIRPGRRFRKFALYPANHFDHNPTNEELLADFKCRHLKQPCLAGTNAVLDARKAELGGSPIVGICGVVQASIGGGSIVGYVYEGGYGRRLDLDDLQGRWSRDCRFLVEVSE